MTRRLPTAGQIDIAAAELALQKSKNQEVRGFAEDMVRDHKAVNDQALALVKKLNVFQTTKDTLSQKYHLISQSQSMNVSLEKSDHLLRGHLHHAIENLSGDLLSMIRTQSAVFKEENILLCDQILAKASAFVG